MAKSKEELELASLRSTSGSRRFVPPLLGALLSLAGVYVGYRLASQERLGDERFQQLVEHLNSPYVELQIDAVERLTDFGGRSYFPLRMAFMRSEDPLVKAHILRSLPPDYGLADPIEVAEFRDAAAPVSGEWIWVGNYDYQGKMWVPGFSNLPYASTVVFDSLRQYLPRDLPGRYLILAIPTNVRASYPQSATSGFAPRVGLVAAGERIRVLRIAEVLHPNPATRRIWAEIDR